ncbi:MAG: phosphoribosylformylglycinamidine cyclo-ligase, partial [Pseudomonadota bacterium]
EGIADACGECGAALLGGETAEMPGMYADGDFDLAGFAIGAAERGAMLPRPTQPGDVILALASDGVHSNGYSLVRRTVALAGLGWDAPCPFEDESPTLGEALLRPTRLYVRPALAALAEAGEGLRALAHVTGGGITENLPRVLADGQGAEIDLSAITLPPVFDWLIATAGLDVAEALRTYNCGAGMLVVVAPDAETLITGALSDAGERVARIGQVTQTEVGADQILYRGSLG